MQESGDEGRAAARSLPVHRAQLNESFQKICARHQDALNSKVEMVESNLQGEDMHT